MKLKSGQYVRHSKFGWGSVVERDPDETMVYFRTVGIKKFSTSLVTFDMVEDQTSRKKKLSV
jgi:hypothetical protein